MTYHEQTRAELEAHLQEQLRFIQSSAESFDSGFEGEAKRIAVSLRVLLHDAGRSRSLLGQLDMKQGTFIDSSFPIIPNNKNTHSGLVVTLISPVVGAKYMAFLDEPPHGEYSRLSFEIWWNAAVFVDSSGHSLSRKDLVLSLANQDGGAHVDATLNSTYANLSRNNSLGLIYSDSKRSQPLDGPEKAALRQIGHEVLKSLIPDYAKQPRYPEEGVVVAGMVLLKEEPSGRQTHQPTAATTVGRNQPCPCNSGLKYKRCCGFIG